jgi:serine protease Do
MPASDPRQVNSQDDGSRVRSFWGQGRRPKVRTVLMGAVAAIAVTATIANIDLAMPAKAQAPVTTTIPVATAPMSFADVVERVKGAVVSVKVKTMQASTDDDDSSDIPQLPPGMDKFFRHFGETPGLPGSSPEHRPRVGMAQGSGFFISADGYIVTNNHVIENATDVSVTTVDGKTMPAKVVGFDKKTDLALLKVKQDGAPFTFVKFADKPPRVGDWVLAVGNPFGLGGTVTAGIVSARGRDIGAEPYDDFLQIDAPVNRGNSGGPTFNTEGDVVGVNTAIYSPSGGSVGIGFAIAADVVKNVVASLETTGTVARGWIGVQIQPVTDEIAESMGLKEAKGALVAETQKGSPALDAGLASGDVIIAVNGDLVEGPKELARRIASMGPGATAEIAYLRDGTRHTVSIKLGTLPEEKTASLTPQETEQSSLATLGLELAPAATVAGAGSEGVVITNIDPDGAGAQRGLRAGDVILDAAGKAVTRPGDVVAAIDAARAAGHKAILLRVKSSEGVRFVALATQKAS